MPPVIDEEKCIKCGKCVDVCMVDVYFGSKEGELPKIMYPEECCHFNCCVEECPVDAITLRIPLPMMILRK